MAIAVLLRQVDGEVPLLGPRRMSDVVGATLRGTRMVTWLLALFGAAGLALGAVGVYGITAQMVSERRREIGIRLALGAGGPSVAMRTILRGLIPAGVGVAFGMAMALAVTGLLEGLLFGVRPLDPGTFAITPLVLTAAALAALTVPAVRASRVDPARTPGED